MLTRRGTLATPDGARVDYLKMGDAGIPVVVLPGVGDGLSSAAESALALAWALRGRARSQRLLVVSRRRPIPAGFSVEQHADDYVSAIERLVAGPAILECKSGGGPIGQWVAVKRPDLAHGLILSCAFHRTSGRLRAVLQHWHDLARRGRWTALRWSMVEHNFRPRTVARYRPLKPCLRLLPPPREPERLVRILAGLMGVDNRSLLPRITCPTLVLGGAEDRLVEPALQREMAELIPDSRLVLYPGYGHASDWENPRHGRQASRFSREVWGQDEVRRSASPLTPAARVGGGPTKPVQRVATTRAGRAGPRAVLRGSLPRSRP